MSKKVKRLFEGFQPKNYQLDINPDRATMHLSGTVTITGQKMGRPSQRLTFHQHGLKISEATITRHDKKGDQVYNLSRISHHKSFDEVRLHTEELLYPGEYTVTMQYSGAITRPMEGIYPCTFKHNDTEKILIATQFESHHAREALPCIDEPEAKATFDLTLTSPAGETVFSNTPIKTQTEDDGVCCTTFETTPKMSTYLLAFVYGDLDYKEARTKDGVVIRTYATPDNVEFTDFALDVAVKTLEFYNDYFDIPYPLEKCDLVALPDFASGAMENWGCVTFREQCMLVDPANTSLPNKQYVAMVVAHELAHQWFGNLVTMRWWTDLWLNEGFASWIEYLAVDHIFPEWEMWTQFIVDDQHVALKLDALENTHPIEVAINHPDEIRTIFDAISYQKGASVIHMLEQYLGHDVFRDGLRHYLKKHMYSNTDTIDLWESLEITSKKSVKDFMAAWTGQAGYPIVKATVSDDQVDLSQELFVLNPLSKRHGATDIVWPIPLRTNGLSEDTLSIQQETFKHVKQPKPLKLNEGQSGFYRVAYNPEHLLKLTEQISAGKMSPLDRLGVLTDTFDAAKAGYTDTVSALKLMEAFASEDNSAVWDVITGNVSAIRNVMNDEDLRESIKPYGQRLAEKQLARLGWEPKENDSHFDKLLRPTIISLAASCDEPGVLAEVDRRFTSMKKSEDIAPDLRGIIYCTVARLGDAKTFDRLLQLHNETMSPEERVTLSAALTNFRQPELIDRALKLIQTDKVRLQDVGYWMAYSFMNRFARDATWKWLMANWQWLQKNLGSDLSFYRMPIYAARMCSNAEFLPEYKQFFESVMEPALERSVKQGTEIIEWQSEWKKRDFNALEKFFKKS